MNSVQFTKDDQQFSLLFSRRYNAETLRTLADQMGIALTTDTVEHNDAERAFEFG